MGLLGRPTLVVCAGVALASSACGSAEEFSEAGDEGVARVRQKNVYASPASDTLAAYAAKCDAATGIHVPAFSCDEGLASPAGDHFAWIPQKTSIDNVEATAGVDGATGTRTPADTNVTAKQMSSSTGNISGTADKFRFAYVGHQLSGFAQPGGGAAEVKIVNYVNPGAGAVAGLMLRTLPANDQGDILAKDSPHAYLSISSGGNVSFRYRETKGGQTSAPTVVSGQGFPLWLRLSWEVGMGTLAEISHDHETWQPVGIAPILESAPEGIVNLDVGVAVASATVNYDRFYTTKKCDAPSVLGDSCDLRSSFQVLARTADAIAVANCRQGVHISESQYSDIAVIQYNRKNGAVCFYQSDLGIDAGTNGSWVTAPSDPNGTFPWFDPLETHGRRCTACHDSGGLIRSPYLKQTGLLPAWGEGYDNNGLNKLSYVGNDFENDRSYRVTASKAEGDSGANCNACHMMAVNDNHTEVGGTSLLFADQATSDDQKESSDFTHVHKNPISSTSPLWMRPSSTAPGASYPTAFDQGAANTAANFRLCGFFLLSQGMNPDPASWSYQPPAEWGCQFAPYGLPYQSPIQVVEDIPWGNGGVSSGDLNSITLDSGANTDIYGSSDTGIFAHTLVTVDGKAMVKVNSLTNTNEYAKAGVMFRSGGAANAANVMLALTAQHGATFQYRPTAGAATQTAFLDNVSFPLWLRLDKQGDTFVGLVSTDNRSTWQQVGQAVTLPGYVGSHVGLVTTAHTLSNQPGQAQFEGFDYTQAYGWVGAEDPHVLTDIKVGTASGTRTEWMTREYITAGGGDIYGAADKFYYAFHSFSGDGELTTTVESLTSTAQWGKAGLMIRDRANDTSKNVFVGKTPSGVTFQYRDAANSTVVVNVTTPNQPTSFRLTRTGNTFRGYYKAQGGSTWTLIGSYAFGSFASKAMVGLAVSSETSGGTSSAVFNSDRTPEPPGFVWTAGTPAPDPIPARPCDNLCTGATTFTFASNYQSGALGTGTICRETTDPVAGGNCSNLASGRTFQINGVSKTCNGQNWSSVPAARNGGYCVQLGAGNWSSAAFTVWR